MSNANGTRTYLRVKRPRHVAPLPSLRVEGLSEETNKRARPNTVENLAALLHQSTYIAEQQAQVKKPKATTSNSAFAVWKRVETEPNGQKRPFRYVDAVLDHVDDEGGDHDGPRLHKRRRLALTLVQDVPTETTAQPIVQQSPKRNIILNPLSRLVQESLQSVLTGECSVSQHLEFLSHDSRLSDQTRHWLQWQDVRGGAGTILHAAALINDVEGVSSILAWNVPSLVAVTDANGQTPLQVAVALGHDQVARVLDLSNANTLQEEEEYVYDIFCLNKDMKDESTVDDSDDDEEEEPTCVELRGGIGYWNENGELILEVLEEERQDESDCDDEDSNCEDHEANDYPEEQFWDSDEEDEIDFRHRPIYMGHGARVESLPQFVDEDEEYDAQHDLYEPSGPQRRYAYDPDFDSESE